jgi:hypothetical protein
MWTTHFAESAVQQHHRNGCCRPVSKTRKCFAGGAAATSSATTRARGRSSMRGKCPRRCIPPPSRCGPLSKAAAAPRGLGVALSVPAFECGQSLLASSDCADARDEDGRNATAWRAGSALRASADFGKNFRRPHQTRLRRQGDTAQGTVSRAWLSL